LWWHDVAGQPPERVDAPVPLDQDEAIAARRDNEDGHLLSLLRDRGFEAGPPRRIGDAEGA
jgi:hypothetical protein